MLGGSEGLKFKVIVLGDSGVGKTALTRRFCGLPFSESIAATVGTEYRAKTVHIDNEQITLQLWDTAGQERFRQSMVSHYYRKADAIIFIYDVSNPDSFRSIERWLQEAITACPEDVVSILIANKCDLARNVTKVDNEAFIRRNGNIPFYETSAKLDNQTETYDKILSQLARKLRENQLDSNYTTNHNFDNASPIRAKVVIDTTSAKMKCC